MNKFFVNNIKKGFSDTNDAYVSIQYRKDTNEAKWLHAVERRTDGMLLFYLSENGMQEKISNYQKNENALSKHCIDSFEGLKIGDYEEVFANIDLSPELYCVPLIRLIIAIIRLPKDDASSLMKQTIGKFANDVTIPTTDMEDYYYDEIWSQRA